MVQREVNPACVCMIGRWGGWENRREGRMEGEQKGGRENMVYFYTKTPEIIVCILGMNP